MKQVGRIVALVPLLPGQTLCCSQTNKTNRRTRRLVYLLPHLLPLICYYCSYLDMMDEQTGTAFLFGLVGGQTTFSPVGGLIIVNFRLGWFLDDYCAH